MTPEGCFSLGFVVGVSADVGDVALDGEDSPFSFDVVADCALFRLVSGLSFSALTDVGVIGDMEAEESCGDANKTSRNLKNTLQHSNAAWSLVSPMPTGSECHTSGLSS